MFYELLQIAIGNRDRFSQAPTEGEWRELFALAQKQAMVGIAFRGVEQLPGEQRPPKQLLMQWYMATERIKRMNADLDRKALAVAEKFRGEGFPGVVLKGQGVARLYRVEQIENSKLKIENCRPDGVPKQDNEKLSIFNSQFSIKEYRTPGDIDIWLFGERKEILDYVRRHVPHCKPVYHHVDFPVVEGLDIEVHFTPSWMNSPVTNRRLQRFFRSFNSQQNISHTDCTDYTDSISCQRASQRAKCRFTCGFSASAASEDINQQDLNTIAQNTHCCARVGHPDGNSKQHNDECLTFNEQRSQELRANSQLLPVPSLAFNRVYILVHIYRHLFAEGIGLRQLLDYYFVLCQGFTEEEREETMRVLRSLKMERFARAVMWVLQAVYGMEERYLLVAPDEREGRFLLDEIMLAGNFGQYDERLQHEQGESALHWGWRKVKRNFRFVSSYPSEVLWSPLFKLWHYFWRKGLTAND